MHALGNHLIIELFGCNGSVLNERETLERHILEAVEASGATPIQSFFHRFSPHGISGIVVIAESHFSIHTWPEHGYCALDIFTCGDRIDANKALSCLKERLEAQSVSIMEIKRGILDLPGSDLRHKTEGQKDREQTTDDRRIEKGRSWRKTNVEKPFWFVENSPRHVELRFLCSHRVFSGRTAYGRVDIVDTLEYGRMLFLDGIAQSAEADELIYHECMVHPAMLAHPAPRRVCIIGGAEGATLREVCRYPEVERIVMADIDEELVALCREHLPAWSAGAFEDPRLVLHFEDGRRYLEQTDRQFDVILVDLADPVENTPAIHLYTREFYRLVHGRLTPGGVACFQGESLQPGRLSLHARMVNTISRVFPQVHAYPYFMPSLHELYGFILASRATHPTAVDYAKRWADEGLRLQYLSPILMGGIFALPAYVERAYARYTEPITDEKPFLLPGKPEPR